MRTNRESFKSPKYIFDLLDVVKSLSILIKKDKGTNPLMSDYLGLGKEKYNNYDDCLQALENIKKDVETGSIASNRRRYIHEITDSLITQCREGMGESYSYGELVKSYIGVPGKPIPEKQIDNLRDELLEHLAMAGYEGALSESIKEWKKTVTVSKDTFKEEAETFFDKSKETTNSEIISLPEESRIEFEPVEDEWYRGYSDSIGPYKGKITLNIDLEWTHSELKKVIAHEGYPGHFAIKSMRRKLVEEEVLPPEFSFSFANTPLTPIIEGTCNLGIFLLGWFDSYDDHISWLYEMLRTAVFTNSSFLFHENGRSKEETIKYFTESSGTTQTTAEQRFRFIKHPLWHTSIPHYWHGTKIVLDAYVKSKRNKNLQNLLDHLYNKVHTFQSFKKEFLS